MFPSSVAYITIFTSFFAGFLYIKDTLKGKTKPNRMSWLIWFLAATTASFVQFSNGAGLSSIPIFMAGFIPLIVLIASFKNKNSYWHAGVLEYVCLVLAILSLVFFYFFKTGVISTIFVILADGLGFIPTYVKSWKEPNTENIAPYAVGLLNAFISISTLNVFIFSTVGFTLYIFLGNLIEIAIVLIRKNKLK